MPHVVLLGDSIFDNAAYTAGGPAVIDQLRRVLPKSWTATLLAVDGSLAADVADQLERLPPDATHLVISAGGNNALEHSGLLFRDAPVSFARALTELGDIRATFQAEYRAMLDRVTVLGRRAAVCTVYDAIPTLNRAEQAGLAVFNELITREAGRASLPVIDLRLVCEEAGDFSELSAIEPSAAGGAKIAQAVATAVLGNG